jgi:hypothetical protein
VDRGGVAAWPGTVQQKSDAPGFTPGEIHHQPAKARTSEDAPEFDSGEFHRGSVFDAKCREKAKDRR